MILIRILSETPPSSTAVNLIALLQFWINLILIEAQCGYGDQSEPNILDVDWLVVETATAVPEVLGWADTGGKSLVDQVLLWLGIV